MRSVFEKEATPASTPCYSIWTDELWRQRDPAPSRDRHSNFFSRAQDITQVDWALPSPLAYEWYVEDITKTLRHSPMLNERHRAVEKEREIRK